MGILSPRHASQTGSDIALLPSLRPRNAFCSHQPEPIARIFLKRIQEFIGRVTWKRGMLMFGECEALVSIWRELEKLLRALGKLIGEAGPGAHFSL
jgi:hypothetical protein